MDTGINLSQEQLQKLSINQIQSLHILSLSAESLHDLLQTALYNFYAASEVDKTSLHKACTKSVGFFADWALETKVPKNISRCICQLIWLRSSCGLVFWYFAKCSSRYGSIFRLL
ncbi:hypothetical protein [Megasphaera sp. BL7]|uniref:hypothetical protein n=1 Tax=Megasphaera sp. BL7 TaxID=1285585 RepID=UPI0005619F29|nr:hypothetical protein [Megasphaera sp. BL7]